MSWDPTKPADGDLVFNSVGSTAIRGNFAAIDTAWDVNHVGIGDTNEGKHNAINMREVSEPTTIANEIALWAGLSSLGGTSQSQLFFKREGNGSDYPITAANYNSEGFAYLPSGILLKWGSTSGSGFLAYNFPTGSSVPAFSTCYRVYLQPYNASSSDSDIYVRVSSWTASQFAFYASPRTTTGAKSVTFNYLAIGV